VAYRGGKAVRGAPAAFASFSGDGSDRTAVKILAHIGDLYDWALTQAKGVEAWNNATPLAWDREVERFHAALQRFDDYLASDAPLAARRDRFGRGRRFAHPHDSWRSSGDGRRDEERGTARPMWAGRPSRRRRSAILIESRRSPRIVIACKETERAAVAGSAPIRLKQSAGAGSDLAVELCAMSEREAFGPNLRRMRLQRSIFVQDIVSATNVNAALWEGLERNDLFALAVGIYARSRARLRPGDWRRSEATVDNSAAAFRRAIAAPSARSASGRDRRPSGFSLARSRAAGCHRRGAAAAPPSKGMASPAAAPLRPATRPAASLQLVRGVQPGGGPPEADPYSNGRSADAPESSILPARWPAPRHGSRRSATWPTS
jgi:hypothetical protein